MKTSYSSKELRHYHLSLQAMRGLSWVTLVGVVWLGVTLVVLNVKMPALLINLFHALAGLWTALGWAILVIFALLFVVVCFFHRLYPSWIAYFKSSLRTADFCRDWLSKGVAKTSDKGEVTVQDSESLEGFFAFVSGDAVLVTILVPPGIGGKGVADSATASVKEYADGVLYGYRSGAMQSVAGARYWIYRRERD